MIFRWSGWNLDHIATHGVTPQESQDVVQRSPPPFPRAIEDEKFLVWGQTKAGRYLQVIFVYLEDQEVDLLALSPAERIRCQDGEDVVFVVHARELTDDEKRSYRRRRRRRRP
jgi:hypothetical protein